MYTLSPNATVQAVISRMFSANKHLGDMFKTATHHYTAKESTSVSFKLWSMVAYMMDLHGQHKEDMY